MGFETHGVIKSYLNTENRVQITYSIRVLRTILIICYSEFITI